VLLVLVFLVLVFLASVLLVPMALAPGVTVRENDREHSAKTNSVRRVPMA
jgi:hypothetical protein